MTADRIRRRLQQRPRARADRRQPASRALPRLEHPVINPLDYDQTLRQRPYRMWASHGGTSRFATVTAYVWADSFDTAFELFVEYLDDHAPGMLTTVSEDELRQAADDLGIAWKPHWPDWDDPRFERVAQQAEEGFTSIGHTTLEHGTHIQSDHWGGHDVTDPTELDRLIQYSRAKWRMQYDEEPPR